MTDRARRLALTAIIAISAPMSLALESVVRAYVMAPEAEELRQFFSPTLTLVAWGLAAATIPFGILGAVLRRIWVARLLIQHAAGELRKPLARLVLDRFLLSASIPQIPAIAATIVVMLGARMPPAIVAMVGSSAAILVQWVLLERHLHREGVLVGKVEASAPADA